MKKTNKTWTFLTLLTMLLTIAAGSIKTLSVNAASNGEETPTVKYSSTYSASYYNDIVGKSGDALLEGLAKLSISKHRTYTTYEQIKGGNCLSDPGSSSTKIKDFYSGLSVSNAWNNGNTWNREHVWCQSLSGTASSNLYGTDGAGSDIHHIRPTIKAINSSRNNALYGEVSSSYAKYYNTTSSTSATSSNGTLYGYLNGDIDSSTMTSRAEGVFEPTDKVKGDVARIIMYVYMHYSKDVSANSSHSYAGTMKIKNIVYASSDQARWNLLMKWNEADPVDTYESNRNNYCASVTGLRNPFIDHPEFANMIWNTSYSGAGALQDSSGSTSTQYSLTLSSLSGTMKVGETYQIQYTTDIPDGELAIASTNTKVAIVSSKGLVTAIGEGTAQITFYGGGLYRWYNLTVTAGSTSSTITPGTSGWQIVADESSLKTGDKVVIVASDYNVAMSTTQNTNNRGEAAVTKDGTRIETPSSSVQQFTIYPHASKDAYCFYAGSAGYLYAASSSSNVLKTKTAPLDDTAYFSIAINNGIATIVSQGDKTHNIIRYNNSSKLFACYAADSTSMKNVSIYKYLGEYIEETPSTPDVSEPETPQPDPVEPTYSLDIPVNSELGFKANKEASNEVVSWNLVSSASSLKAGDQIVIASGVNSAVAGNITSQYMSSENATFSSTYSQITSLPMGATILTLSGSSSGWTLTNSDGKALGATEAKKLAWDSGTTTWTISTDLYGDATISNTDSTFGRFLYNVNYTRFLNYTSDTNKSMLLPQIYKKTTTAGSSTNWTFSNYQLRFSSTFTSNDILSNTYSMSTLTFGYVITPKKYLDSKSYTSFKEAYEANNSNLTTTSTALKAKTDTLEATQNGNNYSFGFVLKGISNPTAELCMAFYVKTTAGDVYFTDTKTVSVSSMVDAYLANDSVLDNYDNKADILTALTELNKMIG